MTTRLHFAILTVLLEAKMVQLKCHPIFSSLPRLNRGILELDLNAKLLHILPYRKNQIEMNRYEST